MPTLRPISNIKIILTLLLVSIFIFPLHVSAQHEITCCQNSLQELDDILSQKGDFEKLKIERIASLEKKLKESPSDQHFDIYHQLYLEYELYNFVSAYKYMSQMRDIALAQNDNNKVNACNLNLAYCCLSAGMFFEANDILDELEKENISENTRIGLYSAYAKMYLDMARSITTEPYFSQYNEKSIYYSKEIIQRLGPNDPARLPHQANIYRCQQNYKKASETIQQYMNDQSLDQRGLTLCVGGLGEFALLSGDVENATKYLCFTSIQETKMVIKETPGLLLLASIIYKQGNIEQAFRYANSALEDANFYNARHRKIEVGDVLPIIETQRYQLMEDKKNVFVNNTIMLSILLLITISLVVIIVKKVKELKKIRKVVESQNVELIHKYTNLQETNKVKEEYIGLLFRLNSAYMHELEELQIFVKRKLIAKQYDDLLQTVKKTDAKEDRKNKLTSFDNIILKLFPNFVQQFNTLFDPQDHFIPMPTGSLTPEMRIFALIRLEVNESDEIAKILNYSVNTINTYKTKTRNRSLVSNEEFDNKIKEIIKHKS